MINDNNILMNNVNKLKIYITKMLCIMIQGYFITKAN